MYRTPVNIVSLKLECEYLNWYIMNALKKEGKFEEKHFLFHFSAFKCNTQVAYELNVDTALKFNMVGRYYSF